MVRTIKRWLGIEQLERENKARAEEISILTERIKRVDQIACDVMSATADILERLNKLTSEPPKAKIEPKPPRPHRANWRTFRNAMEKASDPEQETA